MQRWNELQNEERKAAGEKWEEHGLMFTSKVGTPIFYRNLLRDFKLLLKKVGLPDIRFHDLRHTAASLMLNHGIPVIVVSRRLGHAKPSITLDVYGHLIPSMQTEVAQKIDDLITPVAISMAPVAPKLHRNTSKRAAKRDTRHIWGSDKRKTPYLGFYGGRYRTRTYDLLCVSDSEGLSIVYISHIWWCVIHNAPPVGVFFSSTPIISMSCYSGCTRVAHDMMKKNGV